MGYTCIYCLYRFGEDIKDKLAVVPEEVARRWWKKDPAFDDLIRERYFVVVSMCGVLAHHPLQV